VKLRVLTAALGVAAVAAGVAAAAPSPPPRPGSLDRSFARNGIVTLGSGTRLLGVALQRDGKIVAVGEGGLPRGADLLLARFTSSGALDRTFGRGGIVNGPRLPQMGLGSNGSVGRAVAIDPSGRIVVAGSATDPTGAYSRGMIVERYSAAGALDISFGAHGVAEQLTGASAGDGHAVALGSGGTIIAAGSAETLGTGGTTPRVAVVRLNQSGRPDRSFAGNGTDVLDLGAYSNAQALALAAGGRIVIAGSSAPGTQVTSALIARLTPSGALDRSFAGTGYYGQQYARNAAYSSFYSVAVQPGGKIVAGGAAADGNHGADAIVARFGASGAPDGSFGSGGLARIPSATGFTFTGTTAPGASAVAIVPGGNVIAAGRSVKRSAQTFALWGLSGSGRANSGFGSGGSVLTRLGSGEEGEAAALVPGPGGTLIAVGDESPLLGGSSPRGLVVRYVGPGR
jgi:uncharacterized delta-60 repeat protein